MKKYILLLLVICTLPTCQNKVDKNGYEKDFSPTHDEVKDVDALQPGSNPVLIVHTIKPF